MKNLNIFRKKSDLNLFFIKFCIKYTLNLMTLIPSPFAFSEYFPSLHNASSDTHTLSEIRYRLFRHSPAERFTVLQITVVHKKMNMDMLCVRMHHPHCFISLAPKELMCKFPCFFIMFPAPIFAACKRRIYLTKIVRINI